MPVVAEKAVVRAWLEAWNDHDVDAAVALLHAGYVRHDADLPDIAGTAGTREFVGGIFAAFPDLHIAEEALIAEGELVAARLTISGTQEGEFMGIPSTRLAVSFAGSEVYRVAGGRIAEQWVVTDLLGLLTQLGAAPTS